MDRKLYKIVVADDENTIRRGICNFIDWKRMGYQIVADFEDGKELLEYLEKHEVDVVLTDIRMAEVGGLDVARIISEKGLPVKVVIISGYKEFDYAREALKYNVVNYILKPIQIDEIEKTFEEIYQQLQQKAQEKDQKKGMEEDFNIRDHQLTSRERDFENALRPLSFEDFNGQDKVVDNLRIFVKAARLRAEALDHVLLHGPPGLGKTTLSNIIANELGVGFKVTSGPVLDKPGDLAGVLTSLEPNDVLFIDEIHRLSPVVEEYLYSAMED